MKKKQRQQSRSGADSGDSGVVLAADQSICASNSSGYSSPSSAPPTVLPPVADANESSGDGTFTGAELQSSDGLESGGFPWAPELMGEEDDAMAELEVEAEEFNQWIQSYLMPSGSQ